MGFFGDRGRASQEEGQGWRCIPLPSCLKHCRTREPRPEAGSQTGQQMFATAESRAWDAVWRQQLRLQQAGQERDLTYLWAQDLELLKYPQVIRRPRPIQAAGDCRAISLEKDIFLVLRDLTHAGGFLKSYRAFLPPGQVLDLLLSRHGHLEIPRAAGDASQARQELGNPLALLLMIWLQNMPEDLREPPFITLNKVVAYLRKNMPGSEQSREAEQLLVKFQGEHVENESQPRDQLEDQPGEQPKDQPKYQPRDQPGDLPEGHPRDLPEGQPRDLPKDQSKYQPRDQPRDLPEGQPGDLPEDQPRDLPKDQPRVQPQKKVPQNKDTRIVRCIINDSEGAESKIMLTCQDRTADVIKKILEENNRGMEDVASYELVQVLSKDKELVFPERANIFYGLSNKCRAALLLKKKPRVSLYHGLLNTQKRGSTDIHDSESESDEELT